MYCSTHQLSIIPGSADIPVSLHQAMDCIQRRRVYGCACGCVCVSTCVRAWVNDGRTCVEAIISTPRNQPSKLRGARDSQRQRETHLEWERDRQRDRQGQKEPDCRQGQCRPGVKGAFVFNWFVGRLGDGLWPSFSRSRTDNSSDPGSVHCSLRPIQTRPTKDNIGYYLSPVSAERLWISWRPRRLLLSAAVLNPADLG